MKKTFYVKYECKNEAIISDRSGPLFTPLEEKYEDKEQAREGFKLNKERYKNVCNQKGYDKLMSYTILTEKQAKEEMKGYGYTPTTT